MQERAMRTDWSWERPVQRYIELYEQALYAVGRGPVSVAQLHRRFGSG